MFYLPEQTPLWMQLVIRIQSREALPSLKLDT